MDLKGEFKKEFKKILTDKGYPISGSFITTVQEKILDYESNPTKAKYNKLVSTIESGLVIGKEEADDVLKEVIKKFNLKLKNEAKDDKSKTKTSKVDSNKEDNSKREHSRKEQKTSIFEELDLNDVDIPPRKSKKKKELEKIIDSKKGVKKLKSIIKEDANIILDISSNAWNVYNGIAGQSDRVPVKILGAGGALGIVAIGGTGLVLKTALDGVSSIGGIVARTGKKMYYTSKDKVEEHVKTKTQNDIKLGKYASKKLVKALEKTKAEAKSKVDGMYLEPSVLEQLNKIRGINSRGENVEPELKDIDKFQNEFVEKNDIEIAELRSNLRLVREGKVIKELQKIGKMMEPNFSLDEILDFTSKAKIDNDGEIIFPKSSRINKEFFDMHPEFDSLKSDLQRVAGIPKIDEMTDEQIETLSYSICIKDKEISFDFEQKDIDPIVAEFSNKTLGKGLYCDSLQKGMQNAFDYTNNRHRVTSAVLSEISEINKYHTAVDLADQFETLEYINNGYNELENGDGELSKEDLKTRNNVRNIATQKVNSISSLLKSGKMTLKELCSDDQEKEKKLIRSAQKILCKDLQKAKNKNQEMLKKASFQYKHGER